MEKTPESRLCSRCGKPLTRLEGWVITRRGPVCKECDFRDVKPFKRVRCPHCGREINSLGDALTGHYLGFEEKWEVLCKCYTWVSKSTSPLSLATNLRRNLEVGIEFWMKILG